MKCIFAKLFEQYKKNGNPEENHITAYITIIYFFIVFSFYLPISEVINKRFFNSKLEYNKTLFLISAFTVLGVIYYFTYNKYIKKKHIYTLVKKYKNRKTNIFFLYFVVIFLPVFLLLFAGILTILLKGGTILNYQTDGLL